MMTDLLAPTITLLRGAPGSGKSTFIADHGLEPMTLSFDVARTVLAPAVDTLDGEQSLMVNRRLEQAAVSAVHAAAAARLGMGQNLIIDNTNLSSRDLGSWVTLARAHNARIQLIDFHPTVTLDELKTRNTQRGIKQLAEETLERLYTRADTTPIPEDIPVVSAQDFLDSLYTQPRTIPTTEPIHIVGDIHGCADQLEDVLNDNDTAQSHWVFVGDLFDRGPNPVGVFHLINELRTRHTSSGSVTVLLGNHEWAMLQVLRADSDPVATPADHATLQRFTEAGIGADTLEAFLETLKPFTLVTQGDNTLLVSHGGVAPHTVTQRFDNARRAYRLADIPLIHWVYGVSDRQDAYRATPTYRAVDEALADPTGRLIQFHGHRPGIRESQGAGFDTYPGVYNLEGSRPGGRVLRVATLPGNDTVELGEYQRPGVPLTAADLGEYLSQSPDVISTTLEQTAGGSPIVSYRFTEAAFQTRRWDFAGAAPRGLYIAGDRIIARGYEKFFALGHRHGLSYEEVMDPGQFILPVAVTQKTHGHLALLASVDGALCAFDVKDDVAATAQELLTTKLGSQATETLRGLLERHGVTLAVEVVDSDTPTLVILDCVRNQVRFDVDHTATSEVVDLLAPVFFPARRYSVQTAAGLAHAIRDAQASETEEGVVLRDATGHMVKVLSEHF